METLKKILAYVTSDRNPSLFDVVVAYDSGVDVVVPYCGITVDDIEEVIHNCVFTRHVEHLSNTAVFIGGKNVDLGEQVLERAKKVFSALPKDFSVSVCFDPEGASTTSSACVAKIREGFSGELSGVRACVLAGTGPVGRRVATLLSKEGADVRLTSRKLDRAKNTCKTLKLGYGVDVKPLEASNGKALGEAVKDAEVVVSCGSEGVEILPERVWRRCDSIRILADVNAVPPYGISGIKPTDNLTEREGRAFLSAISIGNLKMKLHKILIKELFQKKGGVYDLFEIYSLKQ